MPGTRVELVGVAPLGDPIELLVRGCSLSIRRSEANCVEVIEGQPELVSPSENTSAIPAVTGAVGLGCSSCARGAP